MEREHLGSSRNIWGAAGTSGEQQDRGLPLDLLQALLPLGVLDPVADDRSVLADVVLKALEEEEGG